MYGMVNQAIKDLVLTKFGADAWTRIAAKASVAEEDFVFMQYYPDKVTYDLVGAATGELKISADVVLREFGKYWVLYTAKEGYGPMMDLFGVDYKSCLKNLNNLHARMGMTMPHLAPPRFQFKEENANSYVVTYSSKRPGLCPMVVGLLEGLAAKYNVKAEVTLLDSTSGENEKQFRITVGK